MAVTITFNPAQFARARALLDPVSLAIAQQAAVSDTVTTGRALVARKIVETLNMKVGDAKKQISIKRGSFRDPTGTISVKRKPMNLKHFHPVQLKQGVRVKIWKDRPAQLLKGTFKITKGGAVPVYERALTAGPGSKRVKRYPTVMRYGPTAVTALTGNKKHAGIAEIVALDLSNTLAKNMNSQIDRFLRNPESFNKVRRAATAAVYGAFGSLAA